MHDDLARYRAARDFLLAHRTDYAAAVAGFRWPQLERFNWALDWFDADGARQRRAGAVDRRATTAREQRYVRELAARSNRGGQLPARARRRAAATGCC